ncbi:MAG: hypothetical protein HYS38_00770, partial [Acidobacteria bacterium]|nr:hypothetical protein [Acidobacteriota bacterium]
MISKMGVNQEAVRGDTQNVLRQKALRLEYTLISYNVLEGIIAIAAGWLADSIALVSFGLDSG